MKTTRIINKSIIYLSVVLLLCSCDSARHYATYQFDNGDDYVSEGLYRIVDRKGHIGYADETGKTVIRPRFAFGYPFEGGKAKVTDSGKRKEVAGSGACLLEPLTWPMYIQMAIWQRRKIYSNICNIR